MSRNELVGWLLIVFGLVVLGAALGGLTALGAWERWS